MPVPRSKFDLSNHLHSSMVKYLFKATLVLNENFKIYIPVWSNIYNIKQQKEYTKELIYIPVWSNIYSTKNLSRAPGSHIYIPVWSNIYENKKIDKFAETLFTFQYGQISIRAVAPLKTLK